jgi:LacI family transcriptional regulator
MGNHVTIKDVAKKAGVSITTVSFVLNKRPDVAISEGVRKRVWDSARELNYHPSALAAGLAGKRTRNIGIVNYLDDPVISNLFYSFVIEGLIMDPPARNYNVLFSYIESRYSGYQDLPKIIREKNVDGAIFLRRIEPRMVQDVVNRGIPVVLIDPYTPMKNVNTVDIDNRQGGFLAAEHLIELGHKAVASPTFTFQGGYETTRDILARNKKLTGLLCANDEMAAGVLRAAREAGRKVPDDLSVVGYDNITLGFYTDPPLTTINVAKQYMGKQAVTRLLELVELKDATVRRERVPVDLIVRGSTAKPSGK